MNRMNHWQKPFRRFGFCILAILGALSIIACGDDDLTGYITVVSPNGGEAWVPGSTYIIVWDTNTGGEVNIELERSGNFDSVVAEDTPNDELFSWTIPGLSAGSDYRIVVESTSDPSIYDDSDEDFSIVLTAP